MQTGDGVQVFVTVELSPLVQEYDIEIAVQWLGKEEEILTPIKPVEDDLLIMGCIDSIQTYSSVS